MRFNVLSERLKKFEEYSKPITVFNPLEFTVIRFDGRSFHTYTKGLEKPYDLELMRAFEESTKLIMKEMSSTFGCCQSDEVSLFLHSGSFDSQVYFDGKRDKILSVGTSVFTTIFNDLYKNPKSNKKATFDMHIMQLPTIEWLKTYFLWREADARRNSFTLAASEYYSHSQLHGKNSLDKKNMLLDKGVDWNNYPIAFRRGNYIQKQYITLFDEYGNPFNRGQYKTVLENEITTLRDVINYENVMLNGNSPIINDLPHTKLYYKLNYQSFEIKFNN